MELCNIHFHKGAEHKSDAFSELEGGAITDKTLGYAWNGVLRGERDTPYEGKVCTGKGEKRSVVVGDTIEIHWVYTSSKVEPGASLKSCLDKDVMNPTLRVESQVAVIVNDDDARDMNKLAKVTEEDAHDVRNLVVNPDLLSEIN
jgi:hypothetical protein